MKTLPIPNPFVEPDPPPELRPRLPRWWAVLSRVIDYLCVVVGLLLIPSVLDSDKYHRYQPGSGAGPYFRYLVPIILILVAGARTLVIPKWKSYQHRLSAVILGATLGISVLWFQAFKPMPAAIYYWSGLLSLDPGKVVRLKVHETYHHQRGGNDGRPDIMDFAVVSLPDEPDKRFAIETTRVTIPFSHRSEHDLEATVRTNWLGVRWIDKESMRSIPDIYNLAAYGARQEWHQLREFQGRVMLLVSVGACPPPNLAPFTDMLAALQRERNVVVVRVEENGLSCMKGIVGIKASDFSGQPDSRFPFLGRDGVDDFLRFVKGRRYGEVKNLEVTVYGPDGSLKESFPDGVNRVDEIRRFVETLTDQLQSDLRR